MPGLRRGRARLRILQLPPQLLHHGLARRERGAGAGGEQRHLLAALRAQRGDLGLVTLALFARALRVPLQLALLVTHPLLRLRRPPPIEVSDFDASATGSAGTGAGAAFRALLIDYVRRVKARVLKPRQAALLNALAPQLDIPGGPFDPRDLKPDAREIWLEIGFGGGEHMAYRADLLPDHGFIGAEPFVNGVAQALVLDNVHRPVLKCKI